MKWGLVVGVFLLGFCQTVSLQAQPAPVPPGLAPAVPRSRLGLSPGQEEALATLDRTFQGELQSLRSRLLAKRLEFRAALANPQADEAMVRAKAGELRRLWTQCQEMTTEYYLKVRAVLRPEQRRDWFGPPDRDVGKQGGSDP
jgi:hypothetical protein